MKHALAAMVVYLTVALWAGPAHTEHRIIVIDKTIGCRSSSDLETVLDMLHVQDHTAVRKMLSTGRCVKTGRSLAVLLSVDPDRAFSKVRLRGDIDPLWVFTGVETVDEDRWQDRDHTFSGPRRFGDP